MKELWDFIERTALQDPAFHQVWKAHSLGRATKEQAILVLLKYYRHRTNDLLEAQINCALAHALPITVPDETS